MTVVNRNELCVVGLQRCGQHAIINWVMAQGRGRRCFLNDVEPDANPFCACADEIETRGYWRFNLQAEIDGRLSSKNWLIYNYEDRDPAEVFDAGSLARRARDVGESRTRWSMIVLRDPFNFFASRLKWGRSPAAGWSRRPLRDPESRGILLDAWKAHAREYLGDTSHLPGEKVAVSYNRWCADREYRRTLARRLGLRFSDKSRNVVANHGPGSSFDSLHYQGRAEAMQVLDRWRHFTGDPFYREIFRDIELWDLSVRAFGRIPGTEEALAPRAT